MIAPGYREVEGDSAILDRMRARVLVVDDDPALAEMLGIVLRSEGFLPSFVADGERALRAELERRRAATSAS